MSCTYGEEKGEKEKTTTTPTLHTVHRYTRCAAPNKVSPIQINQQRNMLQKKQDKKNIIENARRTTTCAMLCMCTCKSRKLKKHILGYVSDSAQTRYLIYIWTILEEFEQLIKISSFIAHFPSQHTTCFNSACDSLSNCGILARALILC